MRRFEADVLIPGRGEPITDGVLIVDGDTITYAGPRQEAPDPDGVAPVRVGTLMPGLWDSHTHLLGGPPGVFDYAALFTQSRAPRGGPPPPRRRAGGAAGVTSIRELGGLGLHLATAVEEGLLGPNIHAAGSVLSVTGGHADAHNLPLPWVRDAGERGADFRMADGPDDCARAVREQLRRNAKVIKVCASGGVMSVIDDPIHQQFTDQELRTIVEVAALAQRSVAAHCHGKPGIMAALAAGVLTIEHGTYLDEEACQAMREAGAILVPTFTIIHEMRDHPALSPEVTAKMAAVARIHQENITRAHEAGVKIAMGSDLGASGDGPASWGRNGRELALLAGIGMTPQQVIEAATANGPDTLGAQAPRSGQLRAGYDADLLVVDGNPLTDVSLLADPTRITEVWKAGVALKRDGRLLDAA